MPSSLLSQTKIFCVKCDAKQVQPTVRRALLANSFYLAILRSNYSTSSFPTLLALQMFHSWACKPMMVPKL